MATTSEINKQNKSCQTFLVLDSKKAHGDNVGIKKDII